MLEMGWLTSRRRLASSGFTPSLSTISSSVRLAAELDAQSVLGAAQAVDSIDDVRGQTHGPGVVGDGAGYGLTDPPRRVSGEAVAHLGVELLDGPDQACVPLLDQILEEHATPPVLLGDGDDQPQVRLDELLTGPHVAPAGTPGEILLLVRIEQPATPHPAQVLCQNVLCFHHYVSPRVSWSAFQLSLQLL